MFYRIGRKIKALAKVLCGLGIFGFVVAGAIVIALHEKLLLAGILIIVGGALASWISMFLLYGFGQLVDNSDRLVAYAKEEEKRRAAAWQHSFAPRYASASPAKPADKEAQMEEEPQSEVLTEEFMSEIRNTATPNLQMIVRDQRNLYTYEEFSYIERELALR